MPVRHNILNNNAIRDQFIQGVKLLNHDMPGIDTDDIEAAFPGINFVGTNTTLSMWDLFSFWHFYTMNILTPMPNSVSRNAAHRGPVFLPWHRWFLLLLEFQFQRVLDEPEFGLPYWDWAEDGDQPAAQQPTQPLWGTDNLGGSGIPISDGPFEYDPADNTSFRLRVWQDFNTGQLTTGERGLRRQLGQSGFDLPTTSQVNDALSLALYDQANFDAGSDGFRNQLEGWVGGPLTPFGPGPGLHNLVHVWVGGDMSPGTSPNDPVFYLNHCNVDRIWEGWMINNGRTYVPDDTEPDSLHRHRLNDPLISILTSVQPSIASMLDVTEFYTYDALP